MVVKKEIIKFVIIGILTVTIDLTVYWITEKFFLNISIAKALGFISGTFFSFLANRKITFKTQGILWVDLSKFILIYTCTLIINVIINNNLLKYLPGFKYKILFAFVIATSSSALLNFTGMKYFVFFNKHQNKVNFEKI